jgi:predicted TIM-barrel fold metal-dependent hydrolase
MPILFHTGNLATLIRPECNYDARDGIDAENMRPYLLDRVARAFPKLTIIGSHLGKPHCNEAINMMETHPNVYFDFSGGGGGKPHIRAITAALMPAICGTNMSDPDENSALGLFEKKLMFATDNPEPDIWIPASEKIMDSLSIPHEIRENFYYRTASNILGLGAQ